MKPVIMGRINGIFSKEIDHDDINVAMLQAGYQLDDLVTNKAFMVIRNDMGQWTIVKMEDWNIELTEVFDEEGLPVQ